MSGDKSRLLKCCPNPDCKSVEIWKRTQKTEGGRYKCYKCKLEFNTPATRKAKKPGPPKQTKAIEKKALRKCCPNPNCRSLKIGKRSQKTEGGQYRCYICKHTFDVPGLKVPNNIGHRPDLRAPHLLAD